MKKLRLRFPFALEILVINQVFIDLSFKLSTFFLFTKNKQKDSGFTDQIKLVKGLKS